MPLEVQGVRVMGLVDSGASLSVIHPSIYDNIPLEQRPTLTKRSGSLRMADGGLVDLCGQTELTVRLGEHRSETHTFIVADIEAQIVLGLDFLEAGNAIIDIGKKTLTLDGNEYGCQTEEDLPRIFRVTLMETVTVPPLSEMVLPGCLREKPPFATGLLMPMEKKDSEDELLIAKSVTHTNNPVIPVRVVNLSSGPKVMYEGQVAAICEAADIIEHSDGNSSDKNIKEELPPHLASILEECSSELDSNQFEAVQALLSKKVHAFAKNKDDFGRTDKAKHSIDTGEHRPVKQPPRRLPLHKKKEVAKEVKRLLDLGVIEPSVSPWAAPTVLVLKKDLTWRLCLDYRRINLLTLRDSYPLPRIDDSLDALRGSSWFSTLDLCSGYYQVEMEESSKEKTAFATHEGLFQFKVMPFGLVNAPATFERLMEHVLSGLHWKTCLIYLDDVICFASTFDEHLSRLECILDRFIEAGLKISPDKCHLFLRKAHFLGHVVSALGVATDPQKIQAVRDWPQPASVTEVRSFVGLASYYRKFIKGFANIARPLHKLTEKGREFLWAGECEAAFQTLKEALITSPILGYPRDDTPYILDTDASGLGIGAVLSQVQERKERVLAYYSRSLSKAERQYCVTRKELLAVVAAVKHFHHFVYGQTTTVRTDHGALRWLLNFKNPEGQMARWIEILQTYPLSIQYRPGPQHRNADGLSRRPCDPCDHCTKKEEKEHEAQQREPVVCSIRQDNCESSPAPWLETWSRDELRAWQESDPTLKQVIIWKESTKRPTWQELKGEGPKLRTYWAQWDDIVLQGGILYIRNRGSHVQTQLRLVAPPTLRNLVLEHLHDHRMGGHLGIKRTLLNVSRHFWWPGLRKDVTRWCKVCLPCQRRNLRVGRKRHVLQQDPVGAPMERMAMDILSFREETEMGNTCVLVIADYFTKWTEAYALPNHTAITVADTLVTEVFTKLGLPRILHSDQGTEFQSQLLRELCKLLEIKQTRTAPYHPQSDGIVERFNRTLINMLAKFCAENKDTWDQHLPYVMCAYRASVHESTGYTPNMMMLGRETTLPIDLMYPREHQEFLRCPVRYVEWVQKEMEANFNKVREELQTAAIRQKRYYDKRAQTRRFKVGDWVWRFYPPHLTRSKLNSPYMGPYLVTERVGEVSYKIQQTPKSKPVVVHVDDLKQFEGESVQPNWLSQLPTIPEQEPGVEDGIDMLRQKGATHVDVTADQVYSGVADTEEFSAPLLEIGEPMAAAEPLRRSQRVRRMPAHFNNFVL